MTAIHAGRSDGRHPVVVMVGEPDESLIIGLRDVGLVPIAEDGEVVIWGPPRCVPVLQPESAPGGLVRAETPSNLLMTIRDAAEALGLGRSTVYELIGRGQLEVVHVGRSARVPADTVRQFVEQLRSDQQSDRRWQAVG